jgi:enoyl-CoA hydratase
MYLGLTGARLDGADCLAAGIGTHAVPASRLGELEARLAEELDASDARGRVEAALREAGGGIGAARLPQARPLIDRCFGGDSVAEIVRRLEAEGTGFGAEQLAALAGKSPLSVHLAFAQLRRGGALSFEDCLRLEYRMVHRVLTGHDFAEGVRALLVDKDKRPRWRHAGLGDVPPAEVEACLAPLPPGEELRFGWDGL